MIDNINCEDGNYICPSCNGTKKYGMEIHHLIYVLHVVELEL